MSEGGRRTPTPPHAQLVPHHPVFAPGQSCSRPGGGRVNKEFYSKPSRTPLCATLARPDGSQGPHGPGIR